MADKASNEKSKIAALSLAQQAAIHLVNIVTNNKPLIDEAFRFADEEHHSIVNEQESKKREEEYNELSNKSTESEEQSEQTGAGSSILDYCTASPSGSGTKYSTSYSMLRAICSAASTT
jgi:hypothetical protein